MGKNHLADELIEKLTETEKQNLEDIIKNLEEKDLEAINKCIDDCTSPIEQKDECGNVLLTKEQTIFRAFDLFDLSETKVLILGQDPYPSQGKNKGRAHGLAFSFGNNKTADDSLKNIYKAVAKYLDKEFDKKKSYKTNLEEWAKTNQILLLNTALTCEKGKKTQHQNKWNNFVEFIIEKLLAGENDKLVVFLWGDDAKKLFHNVVFNNNNKDKKDITDRITTKNLLVLSTSHPSDNHDACKKGFFYEAPNHFKVCDRFLGTNVWKNLWNYITE